MRFGRTPKNVRFVDLCRLVERLGFEEVRRRGSHRIFRRVDLPVLINLQADAGGKAKRYQVEEVLGVIELYGLEV